MQIAPALLLFALADGTSAETLAAPTRAVTIYDQEARVERRAEVKLDGDKTVAFPPLPRTTDRSSIRLSTTPLGEGKAEIQDLTLKNLGDTRFPEEEARALRKRTVEAAYEVRRLGYRLVVLDGFDLGDAFTPIDEDSDEEAPTTTPDTFDSSGWRTVFDFHQTWMTDQQTRRHELEGQLTVAKRKLADLRADVKKLLEDTESDQVQVVATLSGQGRVRLSLSYMVDGTSWLPGYEVRHDPGSENVELSLTGIIDQASGEDWNDAQVFLSTALPSRNTALPRLRAWRIGDREHFVPTPPRIQVHVAAAPPLPEHLQEQPAPRSPERERLFPKFRGGPPSGNVYQLEGFQVNDVAGSKTFEKVAALEMQTGGYGSENASATYDEELLDSLPLQDRTNVSGVLANQVAGAVGTPGGMFRGATSTRTQDRVGVLRGYVFDESGMPLQGVRISVEGATSRSTHTDKEGHFALTGLRPGSHDLLAYAPGMRTFVQKGIQISASGAAQVDIVMEVDGTEEAVYVIKEEAPLVNTSIASMVQESVDEMPGAVINAVARSTSSYSHPAPRFPVALAPPAGRQGRKLRPDSPRRLAGGHRLLYQTSAPETLRDGVRGQQVALHTLRWPAEVVRQIYPAMNREAYVVATIKNPTDRPLPAGNANLLFGKDPAGTARLALIQPGKSFTLALGLDPGMRAARNVTVKQETDGLVFKKDVSTYTVDIEISNPHPYPTHLEVFDQIPVSRDASVDVRLRKASGGHDLDEKTGRLLWKFALAPGASRKLSFVYSLTRDEGSQLL